MKYKKPDFPLVKGDLIAIAYGGKLYKAIFIKYGKKDNLHFFLLCHGKYYKETANYRPETLPISFINTDADKRVVKISQDTFSFSDNIDYLDSLEVLKYYNTL